jgi:hypothetical protein
MMFTFVKLFYDLAPLATEEAAQGLTGLQKVGQFLAIATLLTFVAIAVGAFLGWIQKEADKAVKTKKPEAKIKKMIPRAKRRKKDTMEGDALKELIGTVLRKMEEDPEGWKIGSYSADSEKTLFFYYPPLDVYLGVAGNKDHKGTLSKDRKNGGHFQISEETKKRLAVAVDDLKATLSLRKLMKEEMKDGA